MQRCHNAADHVFFLSSINLKYPSFQFIKYVKKQTLTAVSVKTTKFSVSLLIEFCHCKYFKVKTN